MMSFYMRKLKDFLFKAFILSKMMLNNKDNIQCLLYMKNEICKKCYMFKFITFRALIFGHASKKKNNALRSSRNKKRNNCC